MTTRQQYVPVSRIQRAVVAVAAVVASALIFVGVLSLATIGEVGTQHAQLTSMVRAVA